MVEIPTREMHGQLVGMHYRPPADLIVYWLKNNVDRPVPVRLQREPTNPYDRNAIKVILVEHELQALPFTDDDTVTIWQALDHYIETHTGMDLRREIMLGYIKGTDAKEISPFYDNYSRATWPGELAFDNGKPWVKMQAPLPLSSS